MARRLAAGLGIPIYDFHLGVLSSPYRDQLLPLLERLFDDSSQPVTSSYLGTLGHLSALVGVGSPMPPFPAEDREAQEPWRAEAARRRKQQRQIHDEYYARLAANVGRKEGSARAVSLATLVIASPQGPDRAFPAWHPEAVASLVEHFLELPEVLQRDLLSSYWDRITGPEMLPALRALYERPWDHAAGSSLEDLALRRLYQLAPDEGRKLVIEQLRKPTKRVEWTTLALLEDESLAELNDNLTARLEGGEYLDQIVVRYGSVELLPVVRAIHEKRLAEAAKRGEPPCVNPILLYLLRTDPGYGEQALRNIFSDRRPSHPACRDLASPFSEVGRYAMSPALEKVAIDYLDDSWVVIKNGAAEILGKFGSAAAEEPLWETLEFFHEWWAGREEELKEPQGQEGMQFERTLRRALAHADGWVLDRADLRRLRALCTSDWCRQDVDGWLGEAEAPLRVRIDSLQPENFWVHVGQYPLRSMDDVRKKLVQFPADTPFRWEGRPGASALPQWRQARDEVEEIFLAVGFVLTASDQTAP